MKESCEPQAILDYRRIESALLFLDSHAVVQPELTDLADHVGLSPYHLQKLFTRWAGISPKRFLQVVTAEHARNVLKESKSTLEAAFESGLSGTGRLYDLLVTVDGMTPCAYSPAAAPVEIIFGFAPTRFGWCYIAATAKGICRLEFHDIVDEAGACGRVQSDWPRARLSRDDARAVSLSGRIFDAPSGSLNLQVRGSNFQIQVWRALLAIPLGTLSTYGDIARFVRKEGAARAVGSAVGRNPISYLIPCHRVIRKIGQLGGYRWGITRKRAILAAELEHL